MCVWHMFIKILTYLLTYLSPGEYQSDVVKGSNKTTTALRVIRPLSMMDHLSGEMMTMRRWRAKY